MDFAATATELREAADRLVADEPNVILAEHLTSLALIKIRAELKTRIASRLAHHHSIFLEEQAALKRIEQERTAAQVYRHGRVPSGDLFSGNPSGERADGAKVNGRRSRESKPRKNTIWNQLTEEEPG